MLNISGSDYNMKCHLPLYKLKAPCHRCGYLCSNSLEYTAHLHSVHPCTTGDGIETYKLSVLKYYLPGTYKLSVIMSITYHVHTNCQLSCPLLTMYIQTVSCQILLTRYIQTVINPILLTMYIQTVSCQILLTRGFQVKSAHREVGPTNSALEKNLKTETAR